MTRSKQIGTAAETAVVKCLNENGWPLAERRALSGNRDKGDISGIQDFVIEVKAAKELRWSEWLAEAAVERDNAGAGFGVVWAKRVRKTDPLDWFVQMDGRTFLKILGRMNNG